MQTYLYLTLSPPVTTYVVFTSSAYGLRKSILQAIGTLTELLRLGYIVFASIKENACGIRKKRQTTFFSE